MNEPDIVTPDGFGETNFIGGKFNIRGAVGREILKPQFHQEVGTYGFDPQLRLSTNAPGGGAQATVRVPLEVKMIDNRFMVNHTAQETIFNNHPTYFYCNDHNNVTAEHGITQDDGSPFINGWNTYTFNYDEEIMLRTKPRESDMSGAITLYYGSSNLTPEMVYDFWKPLFIDNSTIFLFKDVFYRTRNTEFALYRLEEDQFGITYPYSSNGEVILFDPGMTSGYTFQDSGISASYNNTTQYQSATLENHLKHYYDVVIGYPKDYWLMMDSFTAE